MIKARTQEKPKKKNKLKKFQMQSSKDVLQQRFSWIFRKIHRKTPLPGPLFTEAAIQSCS